MKNLKTCSVILKPTNEPSKLRFELVDGKLALKFGNKPIDVDYITRPQHIYIVSHDAIYDRNHYLGRDKEYDNYKLYTCQSKEFNNNNSWGAKFRLKIIATTNEELNIGNKIPDSFIKDYIDKSIDSVEVEYQYEWDEKTKACMIGYGDDPLDYPYIPSPKKRKDETIILHYNKNYSREEVEDLIYSAMKDRAYTTTEFFNDWIKKNL